MVRGQSWRALSGVAGTRRLLGDLMSAQHSVRAKRINVHISNRVFRPDDVTKRQSGWLREILGPEGCPRDVFYNCNEEIKRKKEQTIRSHNRQISRICSRGRGQGQGQNQGQDQFCRDRWCVVSSRALFGTCFGVRSWLML